MLDSEPTHQLIDAMMERGLHPYLSVQDYDFGSRRVPSGEHVFDYVEAALRRPQPRPEHPNADHYDLDLLREEEARPSSNRPLAFSGGYRMPTEGADLARLIADIEKKLTSSELPAGWATPEGRQDLLERFGRLVDEDMAERDWQASYAPLVPYAPEPNLMIDGSAVRLRTQDGKPYLQWGRGGAEFEEIGRRLNRLNGWELRRRYEPMLEGRPDSVEVTNSRTSAPEVVENGVERIPELERGRDEITELVRADASNNRLPHRGEAFRTDFRNGAVVTDLARIAADYFEKVRNKENNPKPSDSEPTVLQSHTGLTTVLGRLFSNDSLPGETKGNARSAKDGLSLGPYRTAYRPGDLDTFLRDEQLRPGPEGHERGTLPPKQARPLGDHAKNVLSHSTSASVGGAFPDVRAGIQDEHKVLASQTLALSTSSIRLGRKLAHLRYALTCWEIWRSPGPGREVAAPCRPTATASTTPSTPFCVRARSETRWRCATWSSTGCWPPRTFDGSPSSRGRAGRPSTSCS